MREEKLISQIFVHLSVSTPHKPAWLIFWIEQRCDTLPLHALSFRSFLLSCKNYYLKSGTNLKMCSILNDITKHWLLTLTQVYHIVHVLKNQHMFDLYETFFNTFYSREGEFNKRVKSPSLTPLLWITHFDPGTLPSWSLWRKIFQIDK